MQSKKLLNVLLNTGLNARESSVYLDILSRGDSTALQVSRSTGIKRTTVYSIIESLKQKGLVYIKLNGLKRRYTAEDPEKILQLLDTRKKMFESSLNEFTALYNLKDGESVIKLYEGMEAVKSVYENLLEDVQNSDDYLIIGDDTRLFDLDRNFFQNFIEKRSRRNIKIRTILQDSPESRRHKTFEKNYNETIKILPPATTLTTNMVIIPSRLVIHQITPPVNAIVIETKSIIQMHCELFEIIWKSI